MWIVPAVSAISLSMQTFQGKRAPAARTAHSRTRSTAERVTVLARGTMLDLSFVDDGRRYDGGGNEDCEWDLEELHPCS